jgi:hypothetical protein
MEHLSTEAEHQNQNQQHQPKKEHLEWGRAQVLELSSQGRTEREIATILKVGLGTVARDMSLIHKQAQENLKYHISERLPAQYLKCQNGLDQVLKMAWNIIIIDSVNQTTKLQALSLINDCYKYQMDLSTNGVVVTDAIKYVNSKMDHLNTEEKKLLHDIKGDAEAEEEVTTNGVF